MARNGNLSKINWHDVEYLLEMLLTYARNTGTQYKPIANSNVVVESVAFLLLFFFSGVVRFHSVPGTNCPV